MQQTVDSLANANSKAALARMLVEERAQHAQEARQHHADARQLELATQRLQEMERDRNMYQAEVRTLSRGRDLLLRVLELLLDANETKGNVLESLRRDIQGMQHAQANKP